VFPWDYKTAELPGYGWNLSTGVIDFFAWLGWATELKTVPNEIVMKRLLRTGDGTHPYAIKVAEEENNNHSDVSVDAYNQIRDTEHFWGFGELSTGSASVSAID
jgi:hypothetical protein